jgi:hypothetical protein
MTGEPDETDLPGFLSRDERFDRAVLAEHSVGIVRSNVLVNLNEIDPVSQQPR